MTDVGGLGLVTSSFPETTTHTHSSHTQSQTQTPSKWQQKNQNQYQTQTQHHHSLRNTSTRRSASASLPTSTSTSDSTTTTPTTTTTTKRRVTRSAAAAAAAAAAASAVSKAGEAAEAQKGAGDKDKDKAGPPRQKKTSNSSSWKMSSTITTTTGLTSTAAAAAAAAASSSSSNSSSSQHSSNSTTPTSPVAHHISTHHPHYAHQQHHQHQQPQYNTRSHPHPISYSATDSPSAIQHLSTSTSSDNFPSTDAAQTRLAQDRIRGPLTRKRAATLITTDLSSSPSPSRKRKQQLTIDPGAAARSGISSGPERRRETDSAAPTETKTKSGGAGAGAGAGVGSASPDESRGAGSVTTELDNYSAGGSSVGGGGGGGPGGYGGGGVQRDLICLCTPAPKVPRPRNAFILYRQHHQARVVADHPGLANPEISKIIGEKWRAESDLHKEEWKQLAEEEKLHHQRKYPEYKYQPRRGNKHTSSVVVVAGGSNRTSPTTPGSSGGIGGIGIGGGVGGSGVGAEHPGRCPNCGGRYIATPRTPSTPFTAASGSAKSVMHGGEGRAASVGNGQSAFTAGMDTPRGSIEHHQSLSSSSSSSRGQHYGQQNGGYYRDHRASVSSQGGGYQAYPSRDYHHSQTYHYPTPSHHQQYPAHPLYDMPHEYNAATSTGTSFKRRRFDSTSMPYRPEREYALPSPTTPCGNSSRHPSVGGQYAVRPPSHYHQQSPMSPTPLGHGQVPLHHYPPPPPPTPSGTIGGGGSGSGTGSLPPTPGFAPAPAGPPTATAALSGPASLAPSGRGRSPLSKSMAPPPRPPTLSVPGSSGNNYHHVQQHPASGRSRSGLSPARTRGDESAFDPSLRLPPLQTHLAQLTPNSPESGSSSTGTGAGAGIISAAGGGSGGIGLGITYCSDPRDTRSATSSSPYPRLTSAGNTPIATCFPSSYHQGAHPHSTSQHIPTSVHPSWAPPHHQGQKEQLPILPSDAFPVAAARDSERTTATTIRHDPSHTSDANTINSSTNSKRQLALLEAQQRQQSVEAMVMSIDYVRKASVLRRIGRELPAYGAVADNIDDLSEIGDDATQVVTTRGPIIAVEGPNKGLLRVVGKAVERALVELGDCAVRVWVGEGLVWDGDEAGCVKGTSEKEKEKGKKGGDDVDMGDTAIVRGSSPKSNRSSSNSSPSRILTPPVTNPFPRYLDLMLSWHLKASELTKFVTTPFFSPSSSSSPSRSSSGSPSRHSSHSPSSSTSQNLPELPIALLPLGYSLTYSDRFACTIPIADAYAPVDHWQWMATLWRGIVGPDLTVYVKPVTEEEMVVGEGWAPVGVEVKGDRLIVVRVVVPSGWGGQKKEVVELSGEAEKQLAYEVGEWVRAGAFGVQGRGGVARGERERERERNVAQGGYEYGRGHGYGGEGW